MYSYEGSDLIEYWKVIRKRRVFIAVLAAIGVFSTSVYSVFLNDVYRAAAVIIPVSGKNNGLDRLSLFSQQFGAIPGLSMPTSASTTEIISILNSNILRREVIKRYNLMPVLFPEKWDKKNGAWKKREIGDIRTGSLIDTLLSSMRPARYKGAVTGAPTMGDGTRKLKGLVSVKNSHKDNTIIVSAETGDPALSADLVSYFLAALNDHMGDESKRVADSTRRYLEGQLQSTSDPFIKQKIYNLIAQQIEISMMSEVKEDSVFKVIDPPEVPDRKAGPNRLKIVFLGLVLSLFAGAFMSFFIEYSSSMRKGVK